MKVRASDCSVVNVSDVGRSMQFSRDTLGVAFPLIEHGENWKDFDSRPVAMALRRDRWNLSAKAAIPLGSRERTR
ncbi:MAG: hypothetical protein HY332_20395 [Chloroflexi bacterium]|nr:hypothetical protein [Chloroflexota bacterium]